MSTSILVDGNNLGMAAHFGAEELRDMDGRPVAAIFVFLRMLRAIVERVQIDVPTEKVTTTVAWDSSPSWRAAYYKSYKASRKERSPEEEKRMQEYFEQVPRLRKMLTNLGVHQIRAQAHEADDVAGYLTRTQPENNFVLVSGDKDWLQLVSPTVRVWQPSKQRFVTMENFSEATDCEDPDEYVMALGITGDSGDDVPGCKGFGIKTAVKFLRGQMKAGVKLTAAREWLKDEDGFQRSYRLIELRKMQIDAAAMQITPGVLDLEAVMQDCILYGFESILSHFADWTAPFKPSAS